MTFKSFGFPGRRASIRFLLSVWTCGARGRDSAQLQRPRAVGDSFQTTTKFSTSKVAIAGRSIRPASVVDWHLASLASFLDGDDVSFLIGTSAHLPEPGVEMLRPWGLPPVNTRLVSAFLAFLADSPRYLLWPPTRASAPALHRPPAMRWRGPSQLTAKLPTSPAHLPPFKLTRLTECEGFSFPLKGEFQRQSGRRVRKRVGRREVRNLLTPLLKKRNPFCLKERRETRPEQVCPCVLPKAIFEARSVLGAAR